MKEEQFFEAFSQIDTKYIEDAKLPLAKKRRAWALKKLITVVVVLLLVVLATLSLMKYPNEHYYITVENGEYYIMPWEPATQDSFGLRSWHGVYFDSIQEIYDDFTTCNFTEKELFHIKSLLDIKPGKVAIPNLDRLCTPILPEGVTWDGGAVWGGSATYTFGISQNTYKSVSCSGISKYSFERRKETLTNYNGTDILAVVSVEHLEDRNATLYHTKSKVNGHESSFLVYAIIFGDKEYYIQEHINMSGDPLSNWIQMYMRDGDCYGSVSVTYTTNRPSVEWLSSFGLKEIE